MKPMKKSTKHLPLKTSLAALVCAVALPYTSHGLILIDTNTLNLNIAGKIDFGDNGLVVRTATVGTPTAGVYDGLSGYAQSGLNIADDQSNWWWGAGFASSNARVAAQSNLLLGVGVIDNNQAALGGYLYGPAGLVGANFCNVALANALTGTEILTRVSYWGDSDLNGIIDGTDYSLIDNGFNNQLTGWLWGDYDYNGVVDGTDYSLIDNSFNNQGSPMLTGDPKPVSGVVPEPTTLCLLSLSALGILTKRNRNRSN